jgi:hypothetical protein
MNTPADQARSRLAKTASRKDAARRTGLAAATVAGLLLGSLAVMLLDYGLMLPLGVRIAAWATLVLGLAAGTHRWLNLSRRKTALKEAALDIESARSGLGCEVSTAAEYLSGMRSPVGTHEAEMVDALSRRTAGLVGGDEVPYQRRLGLPGLLFSGGVLAALVGFLVVAPQSGTALLRTLAPWSSARFTGLSIEPLGGEFPVGHPLTITHRLSGRIPRSVEFEWIADGAERWEQHSIPVVSNAIALHTLTVGTSGRFRARAGDSVSPEYPLVAYVPPEVAGLSLRLIPPAYSGLPELRQSTAPITALRGTRARVELSGNVPLGRAELRLTNGTVVALKSAGSNLWQGELTVSTDSEYSLVIADRHGRPSAGNATRHPIRALPDLPPKVDITEPGEDIRADPDEVVPLKIAASDDFGLESITLVFHVLGGPEQRLEVRDRHTKEGQTLGAAVLRLRDLQLKPYDVISYFAEARDNNTLDGPGIGRSPTYFIELTDRSGPPPSKRKGQPQQRLNLIAIQKGILADTTSTRTNGPTQAFEELSRRQREAREFTARYQQRLESMNAPKAAQFALDEALAGMDDAARALDQRAPATAVPAEEKALAALYQAIRAMPQLKNLPTDPDLSLKPPEESPPEPQPPQIVLEAIDKKPKPPANAAELEQALQEAQALAKAQSELADRMDDSDPAQGKPPKDGKTPDEQGGQKPGKKGTGSPGDPKTPGKPEGKPGESGKPQPSPAGPPGPGQGSQPGSAPGGAANPRPADARSLAERQKRLQDQARRLAEKIARMKNPEAREAQAAGKRLEAAAQQMSQAAEALGEGRSEAAGTSGSLAAAGAQSAADLLERALRPGSQRTDVSAEEAPRQFEEQIGEYFRRLTRAQ